MYIDPYIDHCWGGGVWLRAATLPDPGSMITLALLPHRPRVTRLHQHTGRHMQELDCYLLLFPIFRQNCRVSKKYLTWSCLPLQILGQCQCKVVFDRCQKGKIIIDSIRRNNEYTLHINKWKHQNTYRSECLTQNLKLHWHVIFGDKPQSCDAF